MAEKETDYLNIDILHILSVLWKKILSIILVAIIGGAIALGYTFMFVTPRYNASVTLFANSSTFKVGATNFAISPSELSSSSGLVNTYLVILQSRTTLEEVISEAGLSYSPTELSGMISAKQINGTAAFKIDVSCGDPAEAELIANTIANILPNRISDIIDGTSVRIVDYAIIPTHRASPSYTKNTVIGAVAGAALVCVLVVLVEIIRQMNDSVIETPDDLMALYPDVAILSVIPDFRNAGKNGYNKYYSSYYGSSGKEAK